MAEGTLRDQELIGEKSDVTHQELIHHGQLSEEELEIEMRLRRKIDWRIMPLVILVYLMNYIDRNNYAAAKLQGLVDDLHLVGDQYQVGLSILFVGYILMQVPSNLLLNYAGRPSWYLGFFTMAWGLVSACTSQVKSYSGIVACRFILGIVEAPFFAGVLFYLSKWYTKEELAKRMAIFYSGSLISGAFGNLIAAGILNGLDGNIGMDAWQWLYIIEGVITVFIGLLVALILPDFPNTWRAFSPEMKRVANRRLAIDAAEADVDETGGMSQIHGMKLAFMDPKTYMLAVAYMGITGAAGFQNFFPTLTKTLGYNEIISLLLVAPPYVFMVFYSYAHCYTSDYIGNRFWFLAYPVFFSIAGFIIFMTTNSFGPRYFSFFLMNFVFAQNGTIYAWISNAIPRPPAKRAAAFAFINSIGNSASIWTPFTYFPSSAPHYRPALGICIGLEVLALAMFLGMRVYLQMQNKQLARMENENAMLTQKDMRMLQKTAEFEGINIAAARVMQKGYRFMT
ncbi:permease of the major facilitator superfamily [Lindgomyces ingoldianus]|uniref:Permease of the major facilitator superfamily n=1 Tax=Lindgomyces ingoldianus TaxID=673940 RepID=A0ACB6QCS3_9PLEO|nr:permease of the major facilitator superfamily [Lindgomyces ingoldianus]KAF2464773.1 permease of the major facilitator superfamily [Lindgomyces ingoldianus]